MTSNDFSKTKIINYEKVIKAALYNYNNNNNNNNDDDDDDDGNNNKFNKTLISDMAFHMSEIANDKKLVNKYIEKKLNYLITNTMQNTISRVNLIPDYEKPDLNSRIGLKLSQIEREIIQTILNETINLNLFYEISLKSSNNDQTTRNICVHFCSPP